MEKFVAETNYLLPIKKSSKMQSHNKEKTSYNSKLLLKKICEATKFCYGEIWTSNLENNLLELSSNYYVANDINRYNLELFHECSQDFIMLPGEGLPGRVFSSKEPEWMLDVSAESEESFLRNKIAGICGLKTGFAIPVTRDNKVVMVITFFSTKSVIYSPECLILAINSI